MANNTTRKRKSVESTFADKWNPVNPGDSLDGVYLGSERVTGKRNEPFTVYHLQAEDGKRWSIAGAHLDSIMQQIPANTYVWVTLTGSTDTANGTMNLFSVEVEEGVTLRSPYESASAEGKPAKSGFTPRDQR
jgi:hypothetical protein